MSRLIRFDFLWNKAIRLIAFSGLVMSLLLFQSYLFKPAIAKENKDGYKIYRISFYCPCPKCCGRFSDNFTASGKRAKFGILAADKQIKFGTIFHFAEPILGHHTFVCEDRGNPKYIYGNRLDIFVPDHNQAKEMGIKLIKGRIKE